MTQKRYSFIIAFENYIRRINYGSFLILPQSEIQTRNPKKQPIVVSSKFYTNKLARMYNKK